MAADQRPAVVLTGGRRWTRRHAQITSSVRAAAACRQRRPSVHIGGSASVLPDLLRSLSVMLSIDVAHAGRRLGRGGTGPEVAARPWCPSIMRANVPAADGQVLPDLTRAVCGM